MPRGKAKTKKPEKGSAEISPKECVGDTRSEEQKKIDEGMM